LISVLTIGSAGIGQPRCRSHRSAAAPAADTGKKFLVIENS
jgi:hypothetical protein